MKENNERLKTASRLKNWIACNYTTVNEINKKELKKKESSTTEKIRKERGDEFEEKIYKELITYILTILKLIRMKIQKNCCFRSVKKRLRPNP